MQWISTVSYLILTNGQPDHVIKPTRGLRQRDPISPYLYLICVEGLSLLLNETENSTNIRDVRVARGCHTLNHLFFLNDIIFLYRATIEEWQEIQSILIAYEKASGQGINKHKSRIFFSFNTNAATRKQLLTLAEVPSCSSYKKYLNLPIIVEKNRYRTFEGLMDKVRTQVSSWKNIFLSLSGKEVLLKVVIQAIPMYSMSMFMLPRKVCKGIASSMLKFY